MPVEGEKMDGFVVILTSSVGGCLPKLKVRIHRFAYIAVKRL